jgi:hypothetical protein
VTWTRRRQAHVPEGVPFQESWRIGLDLIDRAGADRQTLGEQTEQAKAAPVWLSFRRAVTG